MPMKLSPSWSASRSDSSSTFLLSRANRLWPLGIGPSAVAEVAVDPADHVVEVDAEQLERLGVLGVEPVGVARVQAAHHPAYLVAGRTELRQHLHGEDVVGRGQRLEQVGRTHLGGTGADRDLLGADDHRRGRCG